MSAVNRLNSEESGDEVEESNGISGHTKQHAVGYFYSFVFVGGGGIYHLGEPSAPLE